MTDVPVDLIKHFAPVLKFAEHEAFFPMHVENYVAKCSLHRHEGNAEHRMLIPPGHLTLDMLSQFTDAGHFIVYADYQQFVDPFGEAEFTPQFIDRIIEEGIGVVKRLVSKVQDSGLPAYVRDQALENYGDLTTNPPAYYYRVIRKADSGEKYDVIQYWYFYAYNDWALTYGGVNDHEADWETIQLFFDDLDDPAPVYVGYSAHGHAYIRRWQDVHKDGVKPIVYVGGGSHAGYPAPDLWRWWRMMLNCIRFPLFMGRFFGEFISAEPYHPGTIILTDDDWVEPVNLEGKSWVTEYKGQWGARYLIENQHTGEVRPKSGDAPAGPMYERGGAVRQKWTRPAKWHKLR